METEQIVFLVKFDLGYYAKKQPDYFWSYTDDPLLANQYKTEKAANARGDYGLGLMHHGNQPPVPSSVTIEKFRIKTVMERVE